MKAVRSFGIILALEIGFAGLAGGAIAQPDGLGDMVTELPRLGATEVWEIMNLTQDAHPGGLLGLDQRALEQLDEHVPLARVEGVLPELENVHG